MDKLVDEYHVWSLICEKDIRMQLKMMKRLNKVRQSLWLQQSSIVWVWRHPMRSKLANVGSVISIKRISPPSSAI